MAFTPPALQQRPLLQTFRKILLGTLLDAELGTPGPSWMDGRDVFIIQNPRYEFFGQVL